MIADGPIRRDAKRSLDLRVRIAETKLKATQTDSRHFAAAALYELTSEHHSSIALMILYGRFSSAQALLRPCIEASVRTLWLMRCLTVEQFEELQVRKEWPGLDQIIGKVEAAHRRGGFLRKLIPPREVLNDLTHGGFATIADRLYPFMVRVTATGPTVEQMNENVAALCIRTSDRMLCLAATAIYLEFGNKEAVDAIERAYSDAITSYELGKTAID